jgi:hypothetical protein
MPVTLLRYRLVPCNPPSSTTVAHRSSCCWSVVLGFVHIDEGELE